MQQQHQVRLLPLAPKPLCSPHPYDPAYQVEVQLDEPLWVPRVGPQVIAMEIMALCVQLDSVILTNTRDWREDGEESGGSRRVTFEQTLTSQATAVLQQMREQLRRAGRDEDVETYLRDSGLSYLFPRVEFYLQEPQQDLSKVASPIMEAYFSHLTALNNVLTMAHQLNTDVQCSASHKYIAHQTALLYQCISHIPQFSHYKKEIEGRFTAIKTSCTPSSSTGLPPRLSPELQQWGALQEGFHCSLVPTLSLCVSDGKLGGAWERGLVPLLIEVTRRLVNETSSLHPSLLSPLSHVLSTIQNISQ